MPADEKHLEEQLDEVRHAIRDAKDAAQEERESRPNPMGDTARDSQEEAPGQR
ncbi:hypothetical protein [Amycolatopsis sp. FDAARGOS 1241]|uniref:hypothetical protein n=1 Tax=Amycolatopsis sp. FDAARGOS 1241 TaxID=2778070 RepID=UPI0019511BA9|nr:hypothetical protein [Amycolatopsis sp. FDAARGOS 1241]QRP49578.1 hypothetical protein I6J71_18580 [Amycolatopsis sp. FDAARGOS 1241]